jgi:hypothetical protein
MDHRTKEQNGFSMNGFSFGLARVKREGAPVHPDDIMGDMSPEFEAKQLKAYHDAECDGGHWVPWKGLNIYKCQRCGLEEKR